MEDLSRFCGALTPLMMMLILGSSLLLAQPETGTRPITFNGRKLTAEQLKRLEAVERLYHVRILDPGLFLR